MMKNVIPLIGILVLGILASCSKSDDNPPKEIEPQNEPPSSFDLIGVTEGAVGVDVKPSFSWKAATDPDGDEVTYDLYLGTDEDPTTRFAEAIATTSYEVQERLHLLTDYYWKMVARDGRGGESQSATYSFSTRNLNIPNKANASAPAFSERAGHTSVVHDNKIWVIGGVDGNSPNRCLVQYRWPEMEFRHLGCFISRQVRTCLGSFRWENLGDRRKWGVLYERCLV